MKSKTINFINNFTNMTQYTDLAELKCIDRPRNHIPLNLTP